MREHIRILGILNIVMGSLTALVGIGVLLVLGGLAGFIATAIHSASGSDAENSALAAPIIVFIGVGVAIFFLLLAAPSIIGGWGLLNFKRWSRVLMIIVSGFHLLHIPLGTALGLYGLWTLLNEDARRLLESGGTALATTPLVYSTQSPGSRADYRPPEPPSGS